MFKQGVGSMRVGVDEGVQPQDLMHCLWEMGGGAGGRCYVKHLFHAYTCSCQCKETF